MGPRIVTFCNGDYIPVAKNWLLALNALGLHEYATVICLDDRTRLAFPSKHVLHRPLRHTEDLGAIWRHRITVLQDLIANGESVIHSDADAVWLGDPRPDIEACGAPIVFSQGTIWPPDVHRSHGLVLCCGLFYLASNPSVVAFLDAVADQVERDGDDQVAVNRVVAGLVSGWEIQSPYQIDFKGTSFTASRKPIRSLANANARDVVNITILPHHAYPRLLDRIGNETVVAHPLCGKTLAAKQACLGSLGLWKLSSTELPIPQQTS